MEDLNLFCFNCGHSFKVHEQSVDDLWFCDFEDELGQYCDCNEYSHRGSGIDGDEFTVPYDNDSYRWN